MMLIRLSFLFKLQHLPLRSSDMVFNIPVVQKKVTGPELTQTIQT